MNITNGTTPCNLSDYWISFELNARFISNNVVMPLYFAFGLSGRIISLLSIYQATKLEGSYLYQVFVLVSEFFEILTFSGFIATTYLWSGLVGEGTVWFQTCYICMWYTAYLGNFLQNTFASCTLCLTIAMTVDRTVCLWKPFYYRKLNHRRAQWICLTISFLVSVATSLFYAFIFDVVQLDNGFYSFEALRNFRQSVLYIFINIQTAFRMALAATLLLSNGTLVYVHRRRMRQRAKNLYQGTEDVETLEQCKTLFRMTLCQSILNTIGILANVSYHVAEYVAPRFYLCSANAMAPFVDGISEVADILEFSLLLLICKNFRDMVFKTLKKAVAPCPFKQWQCKKNRVEDMARIRTSSLPTDAL